MSILIENAQWIVTMDKDRRIIEDGAIAIEGDKIVAVGKTTEIKSKYSSDQRIDARNKFITPGLINCHAHLDSTYGKGYFDDAPLLPFCQRYFTWGYGTLTEENYYWSVMLYCISALKTGTTTVSDCGTIPTLEASAVKAAEDSGIRAVLARVVVDVQQPSSEKYVMYDSFSWLDKLEENTDQCLKRGEEFIKRYNGAANGRVQTGLCPTTPQNTSPDLLEGVNQLSRKYNVSVQIHTAVNFEKVEMTRKRWGLRDLEYLDKHGIVNPRLVAVHLGSTSGKDLIILKERDANVAHVPGSGAHGIYGSVSIRGRIPEMSQAGINVTIGSDEVSVGNPAADLVRDMRDAAIFHAEARHPYIYPDPDLFMFRTNDPSPKVLEMATLNGARALQLNCGSIQPGRKADLVMWNLKKLSMVPVNRHTFMSNWILGGGHTADTSIVDGRIVMENGVVKTIDEQNLIDKVQEIGKGLPVPDWVKNPVVWELRWMPE